MTLLLLRISIPVFAASLFSHGADAQQHHAIIAGSVRDASTGVPVSAVSVIHDSLVVAVTNDAGVYEISEPPVESGVITLLYRRIGYASTVQEVTLPNAGSGVQVDVTMLPAATEVERIVVRGERVALANPGLVGFYERREQGFGRYLTGEEIDRIGGTDLTNHLRRLRVRAEPPDPREAFRRPTFSECYVAYVDGIRLLDLTTINEWLPASSLGGIEHHRVDEVSHLPGEFVPPPPPGCNTTAGIVMFWSEVMREPSPFEFGVFAGGQRGGDPDASTYYLGGSFVTAVRAGASNLRLHFDANARVGGDGDKWQAVLNLTARPFGFNTPLYVGMGAGVSKRGNIAIDRRQESLAAHHTLLTGLNLNTDFAKPFVEVLILDPIQPSRAAVAVRLGVRMVLGG